MTYTVDLFCDQINIIKQHFLSEFLLHALFLFRLM